MTLLVVMDRQIAVDRFLIGVADLAVDQEHLLVHLYTTCKRRTHPSVCLFPHTTELSMMDVILGAKAEVGGGTRIVPFEAEGDKA